MVITDVDHRPPLTPHICHSDHSATESQRKEKAKGSENAGRQTVGGAVVAEQFPGSDYSSESV